MTPDLRRRDRCRLCDSGKVVLAVPLEASPIADAYVPAERLGKAQALYPLDLYLCESCGHVQNLDVVNPEVLFRDYLFTTGSSTGLVEHFRSYATDVITALNVQTGSLVAEIGSNDGSLLGFFKAQEMRVLGIDPARDIAAQANADGVETLAEFFTAKVAKRIRSEYGGATVICANNVFAHADDLADMVAGIRELLTDDGVFVFEVSYLIDIVDKFLFDTVYHEHVSYHSIGPLAAFFKRLGMELFDVQSVASKGGSFRGFAQRKPQGRRPVEDVVGKMIATERERGFDRLSVYQDFAKQIGARKTSLNTFLDRQLAEGKLVAAYGASTTTTTLMWHFDLTRKLGFVCDDNSKKHGLYCPACHIPVVPSQELYVRRPDIVVILAWQYAKPILKRHAQFMADGGKFVVPLPDLKIFEAEPNQ